MIVLFNFLLEEIIYKWYLDVFVICFLIRCFITYDNVANDKSHIQIKKNKKEIKGIVVIEMWNALMY